MSPGFFKALCDPSRLAILAHLAKAGEPCTVSRIAGCCPVDISVVSRHLSVLRRAGILESSRRGKEVHYALRASALARTFRALAEAVESCCPSRELLASRPVASAGKKERRRS